MKTKYIITIVIIALIVIGGVYYFFGANNNDDNVVAIGYLPSDHDSALFVAQTDGLYKAQGIQTKLVEFNNGGDLMTAMASGDVDIGYVGITPVLSSIEKGVPVKVISGAQTGGSAIVVGENSTINDISDLKGKSVATPGEASIQYMLLQYALEDKGLSIKDVDVSAMKVAPMNDALNSGKIDAMLTYEPYATMAVENGNGKILVTSDEILPDHPCCVVAASDDFIKNHPDEVKKIVDIHKNATKSITDDPAGAVSKLPKNIVSNASVEEKAISGINFVSGLDDNYKQSVIDFMNTEVDMGILKEAISPDKIFYDAK